MNNKKMYAWILIVTVAILTFSAIIFPSALAFRAKKMYMKNMEIRKSMMDKPELVAEEFYIWYLEAFGDHASNTFGSPLSNKAYHDSPYLTPSFIEHVDEIVAGFENRSSYDPFLCAQNIPQNVTADGVLLRGEQASVLMRTDFPGHFVTLDMQSTGIGWQIANITCAFSPEGTAKGFYTWYLAYIGDPATEEFRNPLVDKSYRDCGFLTGKFVEELDALTVNGIPADPILMAQNIPQDFTVDPGYEDGTAIVHLQFGTETVRHLKVSMVQELGIWKIDGIAEAAY
jgi:hypothetical protein